MLNIKTGTSGAFQVTFSKGQFTVNNEPMPADIVRISETRFHIIVGDQSWLIEFVRKDDSGKQLDLMINGVKRQVVVADEYDLLLAHLGLDKTNHNKVNQIKAPMPGLVISIKVKEGDQLKKGDPILTLEAMKMENIIKAPADAVVQKINVTERTAVEKSQVLVTMV